MSLVEKALARIESKTDRSGGPDACWPWLGRLTVKGTPRMHLPHTTSCSPRRFLYEQATGERPERDRIVKFSCGNLLCMNPKHMVFPTTEEKFWPRIRKTEGCWLWTGPGDRRGYGQFFPKQGIHLIAHRYSWELVNGPVPEGLFVCHHCDTPPCVRPDHLFLGTPKDNHDDMVRKGRHARGPMLSRAVRAARARAAGLSSRDAQGNEAKEKL